jgi:hypothetical protein
LPQGAGSLIESLKGEKWLNIRTLCTFTHTTPFFDAAEPTEQRRDHGDYGKRLVNLTAWAKGEETYLKLRTLKKEDGHHKMSFSGGGPCNNRLLIEGGPSDKTRPVHI